MDKPIVVDPCETCGLVRGEYLKDTYGSPVKKYLLRSHDRYLERLTWRNKPVWTPDATEALIFAQDLRRYITYEDPDGRRLQKFYNETPCAELVPVYLVVGT